VQAQKTFLQDVLGGVLIVRDGERGPKDRRSYSRPNASKSPDCSLKIKRASSFMLDFVTIPAIGVTGSHRLAAVD
jgi:hypothetical protein